MLVSFILKSCQLIVKVSPENNIKICSFSELFHLNFPSSVLKRSKMLIPQVHQIRGIKNLFLLNSSSLPTTPSRYLSLVGSGGQKELEWLAKEPLGMKL